MKVILSRKGFDSQYGGMPSPILPDGTLLSLPIPSKTDMETGQAAQVDTVGVTWGFRPREELEAFKPKLVAESPFQVIDFIKAVNHIE